ncbi:TPA: hypothetical protein ACGW44_005528 [Bacillus toyonensis]
MPRNYKAIFVEAKQRINLNENEIALELIKDGLQISNTLERTEYKYRFKVMNELCNNNSTEDLEKVVLAGMDYFKG